jgi:hypothetical protein
MKGITMNNRVTIYTLLAVMVGYLLISAVPGKVERYVAPPPLRLTGSEDTVNERSLGEAGGSLNATEDAQAFGLGEQGVEELSGEPGAPIIVEDRGIASYLDLYSWWVLDLGVAFSVYWLARRRLG